ncbi:MAG: hypothetical protein AB7E04_06820 [Desulfobacteraceae bacterium]
MKRTPLKVIREKCLECSDDSVAEVRTCPIKDCPLYEFRFGKNPYLKKELTEEQKIEVRERLQKAREAQKA